MKITRTSETAEIDVKRFRAPFLLECECPNCGEEYRKDYNDEYISYPVMGKPFKETLWCCECSHEWDIELIIEIDFKIVETKEQKEKGNE